jgi:hypothetical protein
MVGRLAATVLVLTEVYYPDLGTPSVRDLQFVLAWSIDAGVPVERPAIVACRYTKECH